MGKPGGDLGPRRAPLSREQVSCLTKSVSDLFPHWSCDFSNSQCLVHLEDTLQSLVGEGNAQAILSSPPRQSYGTLLDGDAWDSFGTELPSLPSADTDLNAHHYDQQPDNNILPVVVPPLYQGSPLNSPMSSESQIVHITELAALSFLSQVLIITT